MYYLWRVFSLNNVNKKLKQTFPPTLIVVPPFGIRVACYGRRQGHLTEEAEIWQGGGAGAVLSSNEGASLHYHFDTTRNPSCRVDMVRKQNEEAVPPCFVVCHLWRCINK